MKFLLYFYCKKSFQAKFWNRFRNNKKKVKSFDYQQNINKNVVQKTPFQESKK